MARAFEPLNEVEVDGDDKQLGLSYVSAESQQQAALLRRIGKHSMGKTCLHFKRLADFDESTLEKLVIGSIAEVEPR